MLIQRHDGITIELFLENPSVKRTEIQSDKSKIIYEKCHCNICKICWVRININGSYTCQCGGPFIGYINTKGY